MVEFRGKLAEGMGLVHLANLLRPCRTIFRHANETGLATPEIRYAKALALPEPKFNPLSVIPSGEVIAEQLREANERAARLRLLYKTALKIERSGRKPAHRSGSAPKSGE